jgi:hypothetical protein
MSCRTLMLALAVLWSAVAAAQTATTTTAPTQTSTAAPQSTAIDGGEPHYIHPETPEQRKARLGTAEDPGTNPDPDKHYWRYGKSYHIEKFDQRWASKLDVPDGYVRPFAYVNVVKEIYQENERWVWVWMEDPLPESEQQPPATPGNTISDEQKALLKAIRPEFTELNPTPGPKLVRFVEASKGLPTSGNFRNSLAVADMNDDGCPDLIVPPERAGGTTPAIFLGDCKGNWTWWSAPKWPHGLDYGSVVAADFNKDGHMDLAFSVHLTGVYVFLGDGKGNFTEVNPGLPRDFATRRLIVADVDHDGWPDIVAINEGPTAMGRPPEPYGKIRAFLNRNKGTAFEGVNVADPSARFGGDWLAAGDFNGDKYPDFAGASIFFSSTANVWMSAGPKKWTVLPDGNGALIPPLSYYGANAAGKFTHGKRDDLVMSFVRYWPTNVDPDVIPAPPTSPVTGVDLVNFNGKEPKRTPLVRWGSNRGIWGLAAADFDGDGNLDIVYTRWDPREAVILLGDGKGGFTQAKIEGLNVEPRTNYDIKVADVNGDGRPDIILMYESSGKGAFSQRDGSIHVFLNQGPAK